MGPVQRYVVGTFKTKILTVLSIFVFSISAFAMNGKTTYQAKIIKPDGYPLEASNVNFKFSVLDTVGSCVLYSETYSAINMTSTGGLISFALGSGVRSFPAASATTAIFANVFDNSITSMPCESAGIYNPLANDIRRVVMQFNDGSGWQTLPAMTINAVPYAMYANKANNSLTLNGKADTDFVENSTLAALNCNPVTHAITFNGVSFSCIAVGSSGGGTVTSVTTSGTVLTTGGTASAPVISITAASMSSDGYLTSVDYAEFKAKLGASSTEIISTLGYTPSSSSSVASQIASSTLAGDVSGNPGSNTVDSVGGKTAVQISTSVDDTLAATSSVSANTIVKRNASGSVTVNDLYANAAKVNYVDIYKPSTSFNIRLQAPTALSADYVLSLPTTSGTVGQVLSTDGAGNLSWINPSTGSVTSVSGTAGEITSTGGSSPAIGLADVGVAGTYYKVITDAKGRVTSGVTTLTLSDLPNTVLNTTSVFAGDISGIISNITVNRIQGVSVTVAGLASNDILQYDGTNYVNKNIPTCVGSQYLTFNGTNFTCVADAGASGTITTLSVTGPISSTGGANPTLSIAQANTTTDGYLSSTDWNTFNNKQIATSAAIIATLGYTPATSASLAASFVQKTGDTMTGTLNLPSNGLAVGTNQLVVSGANVGIGTSSPISTLHVSVAPMVTDQFGLVSLGSGSFNSSIAGFFGETDPAHASGTVLAVNETSGYAGDLVNMQIAGVQKFRVDSDGKIYGDGSTLSNLPSGLDNLGDHTATANIILGANYLSGDGDNEGIRIDNSGNVGIGITGNTSAKLRVNGNLLLSASSNSTIGLSDSSYILTVRGGDGAVGSDGSGGSMHLRGGHADPISGGGQDGGKVYIYGGNKATGGGTYGDVILAHNSSAEVGKVGIGTITPVTKLDVSGGVRISMESATCTASYAGTLRYNAGNVEYCNGTAWSAFGVSGAGVQTFNGSTSNTQTLANGAAGNAPAFVTANGVHTLNIPLASATGSVTAGLISNADYVTFSNKQIATSAAIIATLGYTPADNAASGSYVVKSNNLSDLASATVARTNLGLGSLAVKNSVDLSSADATGIIADARLQDQTSVTSGTQYTKLTVDGKGRVTSGAQLSSSDITAALGYTPATSATLAASFVQKTGDTMTGTLNLPSNGLAIGTNQLVVSGGNVGIGTSAPAAALDIKGTSDQNQLTVRSYTSQGPYVAQFLDSAGNVALGISSVGSVFGSTVNDFILGSASYNLLFSTSGTERMRVSNSGNVGIGITNPTAKLHLAAGMSTLAPLKLTSGTLLSSPASGAMEYDGSQLYFTDGSNTRRAIATNSAPGSFDNISSISNSSGNITLSPNNITGSVIVNSSAASISSGTGALIVNGGAGIGGSINVGGSATIAQSLTLSSMTSGSLLFAGVNGVVSQNNSKLFWDGTNERLGIGTNAPISGLQVTTSNDLVGLFESTSTNGPHIGLRGGAETAIINAIPSSFGTTYRAGAIEYRPFGSGRHNFYDGNGVDPTNLRMTIMSSGNVGIGESNPAFKLALSGTAVTDKKIGINGTQVVYLPDQTNFLGSLFMGNGGLNLSHSAGIEGYYNTGVGIGALYLNTTGNTNTANGNRALYSNTTGSSNVANGYMTLYSNTTGGGNVANGYQALYLNTTGNYNVANGIYALAGNTTGSDNVATGQSALGSNTTGSHNIANGTEALYLNTTGVGNVANGSFALRMNSTGDTNTANGYAALFANTSGSNNVANGNSALYANTTGSLNVANGVNALRSNTTASNNVANGYSALNMNTTGAGNVAMGTRALYSNSTKSESTAIGFNSMYYADSVSAAPNVSYNTAIGAYSLQGSTTAASNTGVRNTALGHSTLMSIESGSSNTAVGYNAGSAITTGSNNVILGSDTGSSIATSSNNILIADGAGNRRMTIDSTGKVGIGMNPATYMLSVNGDINVPAASRFKINGVNIASGTTNKIAKFTSTGTVGNSNIEDDGSLVIVTTDAEINGLTLGKGADSGLDKNTALGNRVLRNAAGGDGNTGIGYQTLMTNSTGEANTALGAYALTSNDVGGYNTAVGVNALSVNVDGNYNVATGNNALSSNTSGSDNIANGYEALSMNTTGTANVAMGVEALASNDTGGTNTAIGNRAFKILSGGNGNTALGAGAGRAIVSGTNNIVIGGNDGLSISGLNNNIIISDGAGNIRIRSNSTGLVYTPGDLQTEGCLYYSGGSLGVCVSDQRLKKDVHSFDLGLETLLGINPKSFKYNGLAGRAADGKEQLGVIAQDLEKSAPSLVKRQMVLMHPEDKEKTEIKVVDYGAFTYVIINAIKNLYHMWFDDSAAIHRELASVKEENLELKKKNEEIQKRLDRIEKILSEK